ncbi:hypothetical protein C7974DRAFT_5319 [Boeremia exigua]|uniref:uncharacterized protein n=1 Tax=Boeremia exigua TaxID=749465 RepID=UPI001E8D63D7|nr:uncharacterized protein C7974DRAFT_5319 [Boeremia exigua]KAH6643778.1 hypothetical protein C7974DRAFT_5319 [Boeremia exigua]
MPRVGRKRARASQRSVSLEEVREVYRALRLSRPTSHTSSHAQSQDGTPREEAAPAANEGQSYPRASLLGIPAELRLEIYDYLWDNTLIHIHKRPSTTKKGLKLTWTPCLGTNLAQLCSHPSWDNTVNQEERCSEDPKRPDPTLGIFAMRFVCKALHDDLKDAYQYKPTISLSATSVSLFIKDTPRSSLERIESLTFSSTRATLERRHSRYSDYPRTIIHAYRRLRRLLPKLQTVKFQWCLLEEEVQGILDDIRNKDAGEEERMMALVFREFQPCTLAVFDASYGFESTDEYLAYPGVGRLVIKQGGRPSESTEWHPWGRMEVQHITNAREFLGLGPEVNQRRGTSYGSFFRGCQNAYYD